MRQLLEVPPLQEAQLESQIEHYNEVVRYLEETQVVQALVPAPEQVKQVASQATQFPPDP